MSMMNNKFNKLKIVETFHNKKEKKKNIDTYLLIQKGNKIIKNNIYESSF